MVLKICEFLSMFLSALVAGVFWGPWLGLTRSGDTFPPEVFLSVAHRMIRNLAPIMPVLMCSAILTTLSVLFVSHGKQFPSCCLNLAGLLCFAVAMLVTLIVEVPIDNQIKSWTLATLPQHWEHIWHKWETFHTVRTGASLLGLGFLVAGALL
jgi:uncharacterized membrane protein